MNFEGEDAIMEATTRVLQWALLAVRESVRRTPNPRSFSRHKRREANDLKPGCGSPHPKELVGGLIDRCRQLRGRHSIGRQGRVETLELRRRVHFLDNLIFYKP